jgi:hypothetical protein
MAVLAQGVDYLDSGTGRGIKVLFSSVTGGTIPQEVSMGIVISVTQQKRVDKIARLQKYFTSDRPEIYEWDPKVDEAIDWKSMTDEDLAKYLQPS